MNKTVLILGNANSIHFRRWYSFLKAADLTVSILTLTTVEEKNRQDYLESDHFYDFSKYNRLTRFFKVIQFIKKHHFDYINVHYLRFSNAVQSFFTAQKFVYTCWGSDILINYQKAGFVKKPILNLALKKAYAITFDSTSIDKILTEQTGVTKDRLKLIYWGVDTALFSPATSEEKKALRKKYNLPEKAIIILSIRGLRTIYNIDKIIKWFNSSISDDSLYLYIKVPPSPDKAYLEECKRLANGNSRIIFDEEFTPYEKLNELYRLADINIHFPQSDATPVTMLEALSCENRIIASSKIAAYKELASRYQIKLTTLNELKEKMVLDNFSSKSDSIKINRDLVQSYHSQSLTIKSLKALFS